MNHDVGTSGTQVSRHRQIQARSGVWRSIIAALLLTPVAVLSSPAHSAAVEDVLYVDATGHTIGGTFLSFWEASDGAERLGMPITEPVARGSSTVQYFEMGVLIDDRVGLRIGQEQAGSGSAASDAESDTVAEFPVGAELLAVRSDPTQSLTGRRISGSRALTSLDPGPTDDGTSVAVARPQWIDPASSQVAAIGDHLEQADNADHLGAALTEPMVSHGQVVQWFERGRLSVYTRGEPVVRRAAIGWEMALRDDVAMSPVPRGNLVSLSEAALNSLATAENPVDATTAGDGTIINASGAFAPVSLSAPAIGLQAPIEYVGIVNGIMQTPANPMAVGWYGDVSAPGTGSTVVVAGHVDYYTVGPAAFANLGGSGPGTRFYLTGPDGTGATYEFSYSYVLGAGEPADGLLAGTGVDSLVLITCTGGFSAGAYDSRLIVYAERI